MTEKQAAQLMKHFEHGVNAHIWCYSGDGNWAISIEKHDSEITFHGVDELKRCVAALQKALGHVQSVSNEECWRDAPTDPFATFQYPLSARSSVSAAKYPSPPEYGNQEPVGSF